MNPMTPEELEKFIHQNLRTLPARRAPRSLEARVRAALEQQATIPWYHRSWSYWPNAVRAAFVGVAGVVTGGILTAFSLGFNGVETNAIAAQAGAKLGFVVQLYHVAAWIANFTAQVAASIPSAWIYGAVVAIGGLYAMFFGLGAAAYRTLYRNN